MNVNVVSQVNSSEDTRPREKERIIIPNERERVEVERMEKDDSFDEELKVIGKICRVYHQGKQLYPVEKIYEHRHVSPVHKNRYVIIPIKSKNNCVEFIKVPLMKADKGVKAANIGNINVAKIDPDGCERVQKLPLWMADKAEILLLECRSSKRYSKDGRPDGQKRESVEYVYKRREEHAGTQTPEPGSTRKFRCRRKSKGTPPKDKKKTKKLGNKKAKD